MPRYHNKADIEGLLRQVQYVFTETSAVPIQDLETYIADTERYVESRLAKVYVTPLTDTEARAIIKPVCSMLTAAKCWRIFYAAQAGESDKAREWQKEAEATIEMIVNDEMAFGNAQKARPAGGLYSGMRDSRPLWKLNKEQW